jgi:DNA repair and recombination protein RAD54B
MAFNINGKRPSDEFLSGSEKKFTGNYRFGQEIWSVQWRLPQTKKHKTWENDGVVLAQNGKFLLYDSSGAM